VQRREDQKFVMGQVLNEGGKSNKEIRVRRGRERSLKGATEREAKVRLRSGTGGWLGLGKREAAGASKKLKHRGKSYGPN